MLKEERQQAILNDLYQDGKVIVHDLANKFHISQDTVRRDLSELEAQGTLKRVFGGAIPDKIMVPSVDQRTKVKQSDKYLMAKKALKLIKQDSLIVIDGGSSNLMLMSLLPASFSLRVVTNSFLIVNELKNRVNVDVTFLGGKLEKKSQTTVGDTTLQELDLYHFDQSFIGVHAMDVMHGISVPFQYDKEASIKRKMIENSDETIVLCSFEKLEKVSNYVVCPLDEVDTIVCNQPLTKEINQKYQNKIL